MLSSGVWFLYEDTLFKVTVPPLSDCGVFHFACSLWLRSGSQSITSIGRAETGERQVDPSFPRPLVQERALCKPPAGMPGWDLLPTHLSSSSDTQEHHVLTCRSPGRWGMPRQSLRDLLPRGLHTSPRTHCFVFLMSEVSSVDDVRWLSRPQRENTCQFLWCPFLRGHQS